MQDSRTLALVLKRTNYQEADRILHLLTPDGKVSAIAKGVRKEKSKLASGVEMFCLSELTLHFGKSDFAVITSAKPKEFYKNILTDFTRLEVASSLIKTATKFEAESPEYFSLLVQALKAINSGAELLLVQTWYYFNLARINGEQVNLSLDVDGKDLIAGENYTWAPYEMALKKNSTGKISTNEIKMMRLILSADLELILRVKDTKICIEELLFVSKSLNQL